MVNYRRNRIRNGTYAFTITLRDRRSTLLVDHIETLFIAWRRARRRVPHRVIAFVILPDHIHALATMRDGRDDNSRLIQEFKKGFTRRLHLKDSPWQSRFWEHTIRDERDLRNHVEYIHYNPVKHGWCNAPDDWKFSSAHRTANAQREIAVT